jgi:hypothetical protein
MIAPTVSRTIGGSPRPPTFRTPFPRAAGRRDPAAAPSLCVIELHDDDADQAPE